MKLEIEIRNCISFTMQMLNKSDTVRGGSRAAATSKMERLEAVNYYHKVLHPPPPPPPLTVYLAVEISWGRGKT